MQSFLSFHVARFSACSSAESITSPVGSRLRPSCWVRLRLQFLTRFRFGRETQTPGSKFAQRMRNNVLLPAVHQRIPVRRFLQIRPSIAAIACWILSAGDHRLSLRGQPSCTNPRRQVNRSDYSRRILVFHGLRRTRALRLRVI